jgi:hypothetical protein
LFGQSNATALFSTVRYNLCGTYIDFPLSANSGKSALKHGGARPLQGKGDSRLSYSGIDDILVSHFLETKNCQKDFLTRQSFHKSISH